MTEFKLTKGQATTLSILKDFMDDKDPKAKYMVVQGDSGTGKSTLIKEMCQQIPGDVLVTATTNKAAEVISTMLGKAKSTIHSALSLTIKNDHKTGKEELTLKEEPVQLRDNVIIIDEASFISDELFKYLDEATKYRKIVMVGDQFQLAPVNQAVPVMESIDTKYRTYLTEIVRHEGAISNLGKQFKESVITGIFKPIVPDNKSVFHVKRFKFFKLMTRAFSSKNYTSDRARVLAYSNYRVLKYNKSIRNIRGEPSYFEVGEQIITNKPCIGRYDNYVARTDSYVSISKIHPEEVYLNIKMEEIVTLEDGALDNFSKVAKANFIPGKYVSLEQSSDDVFFLPDNPQAVKTKLKEISNLQKKRWSRYFFLKNNCLDLRSVYSSTVHKAQGSEYQVVFIDLDNIGLCEDPQDAARLLYVALTRATKTVILVGSLPCFYRGA